MSRKIVTAIGASIPHKAFDSKNGLQAINILRRISPDGHPNPKPRLAPGCLSAEKSRARFFAPLRCAQNDSRWAGRVCIESPGRDSSPAGRDQDDSEGLRMTAWETSTRMSR
jgi:hypothetical protein